MGASAFQGTLFKIGSPLVTVSHILEMPTIVLHKRVIDVSGINDTSEQSIIEPFEYHDEFSMTIAWDPVNTQHIALLAAYTGETTVACQVTMKDAQIFTFSAYVIAFDPAGARGQASQRKLTLKPSGAITIS